VSRWTGFTFLGQFVDHDMTFDQTPLGTQQLDPHGLTNFDTPRFDLASVCGRAPQSSPELYDPTRPGRLRLEQPHGIDDLPRLIRRAPVAPTGPSGHEGN